MESRVGSRSTWESAGQIGAVRVEVPTIQEAVEKYLADARSRRLTSESLKKLRYAVEQLFLTEFCDKHRYRLLRQVGVDQVREFRNHFAPGLAASTVRNRLDFLRGFFRFCQVSGWMPTNPVSGVTLPKVKQTPTLPFEEEEVERMLSAAERFTAKGVFGGDPHRRGASIRRGSPVPGGPRRH